MVGGGGSVESGFKAFFLRSILFLRFQAYFGIKIRYIETLYFRSNNLLTIWISDLLLPICW